MSEDGAGTQVSAGRQRFLQGNESRSRRTGSVRLFLFWTYQIIPTVYRTIVVRYWLQHCTKYNGTTNAGLGNFLSLMDFLLGRVTQEVGALYARVLVEQLLLWIRDAFKMPFSTYC